MECDLQGPLYPTLRDAPLPQPATKFELTNVRSYIPDGISIASSTSKFLTFVTAGCFGFPSAPERRHTPDEHGRGRRRPRERLSAPLDCYYLILCKELLTTTCV